MTRARAWLAVAALTAAGAALLPAWLSADNVLGWTLLASFCE